MDDSKRSRQYSVYVIVSIDNTRIPIVEIKPINFTTK